MRDFLGMEENCPKDRAISICNSKRKLYVFGFNSVEPFGVLRYGSRYKIGTQRNDGRVGEYTAYSPWPRAFLIIFCVLFSSLVFTQAVAQGSRGQLGTKGLNQTVLRGVVSSFQDGTLIEGASVSVDKKHTRTDKQGRFTISVDKPTGVLLIKHIGYKEQRVAYENTSTTLNIALQANEKQIEEVEVVSTGYQKIPKERATGSFEFIDSALFNRKVSTDFVSRLEDVVPGISSSKFVPSNRGKLLNVNVRGVSTMSSERWPLVVVDGVPYPNNFDPLNGSFNNINPNDIENVTVLKDAAAASIWGAQSGNGVIVITTKKGKYNQPFQLAANTNVTIAHTPDLYSYPQMNTSDYIDAERYLFDKGYWDSRMYNYSVNLTPVIQLLKKHKENSISELELNRELDALRDVDMRDDILKYMYRPAVNQQYNLSLRGGGEKINTFFSIGYDDNKESLVTSSYNRLTAKNSTQLRPIKNLTLDLGLTYTESKRKDAQANMVGYNIMGRGIGNFPYMRLVDDNHNPAVVDVIGYNPIFRDTVAGGRLLDWKYRPLAELYDTHNLTNVRETFLNARASYQLFPSLSMSALYAYQRSSQPTENWQGLGSVHLRATINHKANWTNDEVIWNLPVGDYLDLLNRNNQSQQFRYQLDFNKRFADIHQVDAIAGAELRQVKSDMASSTFWGYDPEVLTYQPVEYGKLVRALNGIDGGAFLYDYSQMEGYTNRYTSYFANTNYTYNSRYIASASVRKDASNLFGVKSNDRGQPFWSAGIAWVVSNEAFVNSSWFPLLKLRATYGYNGNVNNSISAYPIISIQNSQDYTTGQPYAVMESPPNPTLRWERVGMLNLGLDFSLRDRISGTLEYYIKRPTDLIAGSQIDPTTGFSSLSINSADLDGRGVDLTLHTVNIFRNSFKWMTDLVFAYNRTKVLKSYGTDNLARNYISGPGGMLMTPFEGMDLYSQLTYPWAGLDPADGSPRGWLDGEISKDYGALVNRSTVDQLDNHGSLRPLYFGSLRNSFQYKSLEFSFNIAFNLGHKFLRTSFNNSQFVDNGTGHSDYAKRWQNPGDELTTDVPAFSYPANFYASGLYYLSSALVEDASWFKLRDLQFSYSLPKMRFLPVKAARIYAYAQNIGIIWRANSYRIDPEYGGRSIPDPLTLSFGLNLNL